MPNPWVQELDSIIEQLTSEMVEVRRHLGAGLHPHAARPFGDQLLSQVPDPRSKHQGQPADGDARVPGLGGRAAALAFEHRRPGGGVVGRGQQL